MDKKKGAVLTGYILLIIFVILKKSQLLGWVQSEDGGQFPIVFIGVVLLAIVPFIPFGIVSAVIGAKYGLIWGSLFNLAASASGALLTYYIFSRVFNNTGKNLLQKSIRIKEFEKSIRKNAFWTVFICRLIPILPAFLINCYAGVFKLPINAYMLATIFGKIPAMVVFSYIGDQVISGSQNWINVIVIYTVFTLIIYLLYKVYLRQRKSHSDS